MSTRKEEVKLFKSSTVEDSWREFSSLYNTPVSVVQTNGWAGYGVLVDETRNYIILDPITDEALTGRWKSHLISMRTLLKKNTVISIIVLDKEHTERGQQTEEPAAEEEPAAKNFQHGREQAPCSCKAEGKSSSCGSEPETINSRFG